MGIGGQRQQPLLYRTGQLALHATWLAGCRYLRLDDRVVVTNRQALIRNPQAIAIGEADFGTNNQFVGGQIGSRLGVVRGSWALDVTTKVALGETHLVSEVSGSPLIAAPAFSRRWCRDRYLQLSPVMWVGRRRIESRSYPSSMCGCAGRCSNMST